MTELSNMIATEIRSQLDANQLILPTLPELALKAREAAEQEDVTIEDMVEVVRHDAAMSARLIKIANSPLMRTKTAVTDVRTAMMRLGLDFACNLIIGLAMEQIFQATTDLVDEKLRSIWSTSTAIAGRASIIARHFSDLPEDEAALAGLVHLIGALPILTYVEENSHNFTSAQQLDSLIQELHPQLGKKILEAWDFPKTITVVPSEFDRFDRKGSNQIDCADVIMIAHALHNSLGNQSLTSQEIPSWHDIPAFARAGITIDSEEQHSPDFDALESEFKFAIKTLR